MMTTDPKERRRRSDAQEKALAALVGGQVSKGSGSGWRQRNDVRSAEYLFECKRTDKESISVKLSVWEQLAHNAYLEDREPILHLEIDGKRLIVMNEDLYTLLAFDDV